MMHRELYTAATLLSVATSMLAAQAPGTDVWLVPLDIRDGRINIGTATNISARPGYDNQPSFTRDGKRVYFTTSQAGEPSDIQIYDIKRKEITPATRSPESEYSAQQFPGIDAFGAIVVELDSTQRLWRIDAAKAERKALFEKLKPVGYWAAIDDRNVAMFVLGSPPAFVIGDTRTGKIDTIATGIGRSVQRIPNERAFSFTQPGPDSAWRIRRVDAATHAVTDIALGLRGSQDLAWTPSGRLFMAKGNTLYARAASGDTAWIPVKRFDEAGLQQITRIAVSPQGNYLAIVGAEPGSIGVAVSPPANPVRPMPPTIRPTPNRSVVVEEVPATAPKPLTLIIVRHAEKAAQASDPPLSSAGTERASELAKAIGNAHVTGIIVTSYQRTQQTAAPAAQSLGLVPLVMPIGGSVAEHARAIVDSARTKFGGGTVLVVGHTNTIPAIIAAAGGAVIADPCESQYDGMWIVQLPAAAGAAASLIQAHYGATSAIDPSCSTMRMKP